MAYKQSKINKSKMATRKPVGKKVKTRKASFELSNVLNMKIILVILSVSALIALVALTIKYKNKLETPTKLLPIKIVEIEGELNHVSRDEIIDVLKKNYQPDNGKTGKLEFNSDQSAEYLGFMESDLQMLEKKLEQIPWIQSVVLRRVWPDKLHMEIKEQTPIAHWNSESLINEYGEVFTPDEMTELSNLPEINGPEDELSRLLETFKHIQSELNDIDLKLSKLDLDHRYAWQLVLDNGIALDIGRIDLLDRVKRFVELYPLLLKESNLPIEKVDLRYDTGLAVLRLETSERQASL